MKQSGKFTSNKKGKEKKCNYRLFLCHLCVKLYNNQDANSALGTFQEKINSDFIDDSKEQIFSTKRRTDMNYNDVKQNKKLGPLV